MNSLFLWAKVVFSRKNIFMTLFVPTFLKEASLREPASSGNRFETVQVKVIYHTLHVGQIALKHSIFQSSD